MIVVLSGGVGGARFLRGLSKIVSPSEIIAVVNTGDDIDLCGLHISPDLDIVTYTLASVVDEQKGWGFAGDSFRCLEVLSKLGEETWFLLGDQDLATHLFRTRLLRSGLTLSTVTARIAERLSVKVRILPMTDDAVQTWIDTDEGQVHFQAYLVQRRAQDPVRGVVFRGIDEASPAPGVLEALESAEAILIAPSNPVVSVAPILGLPGVRDAMRRRRGRIAAVSPIVAGAAIKGPAVEMMRGIGVEASALGVARLYSDVAGLLVVDEQDKASSSEIEKLGVRTLVRETIMKGIDEWSRLARATLEGVLRKQPDLTE